MSEPTPVFDPPVLENAASTVVSEGPAPPAATIENGGVKENNGQDATMAGLEDSGVKAVKTGPDQAVSDAICCTCHQCSVHLGWHSLLSVQPHASPH